jgi:hypothetical protein
MRIEPILAAQAKARQVAAVVDSNSRRADPCVLKSERMEESRDINATKTATQAAEAAGLKRDTYHKAKTVLQSAPAPIVQAVRVVGIVVHSDALPRAPQGQQQVSLPAVPARDQLPAVAEIEQHGESGRRGHVARSPAPSSRRHRPAVKRHRARRAGRCGLGNG